MTDLKEFTSFAIYIIIALALSLFAFDYIHANMKWIEVECAKQYSQHLSQMDGVTTIDNGYVTDSKQVSDTVYSINANYFVNGQLVELEFLCDEDKL